MRSTSITCAVTAPAIITTVLMVALATCALGQQRGNITGVVHGAAAGVVVVVATNQVTSKVSRTRVGADGHYALRLPAGAYRITVEIPYVAKFDEKKKESYGEHVIVRDDALENVIVGDGKNIAIDFEVEKKEIKTPENLPQRKPLGAAGGENVPSQPQTQPDRGEVRDRLRIGF